jgi:hypothetical protein
MSGIKLYFFTDRGRFAAIEAEEEDDLGGDTSEET